MPTVKLFIYEQTREKGMKEKLLKIFFVLSMFFLIFTIFVKSVKTSSAEIPIKPVKITNQNPDIPCMKQQQRVILEKLHRIEEKVR